MSLSNKLCAYIKRCDPTKSDIELDEIMYGFDALFMNLDKFIVFIAIGYIFHVTLHMLIAIVTYGLLRLFAFGVHAKNKIQCFIISFFIFIPNLVISENLKLGFSMRTSLFIIAFVLILIYAPADTELRPLPNEKIRKKFKSLSAIYATLIYILSIKIFDNSPIGSIMILSIFFESILITPLIYKILKRRYDNYETYTNE